MLRSLCAKPFLLSLVLSCLACACDSGEDRGSGGAGQARPGVPEAVEEGKTGFIVPPRDSEALARAVIRLLRDEKLRRQMGENAYRKLKEDFSWDGIALRTVEVYEKAIEARRRGKAQ